MWRSAKQVRVTGQSRQPETSFRGLKDGRRLATTLKWLSLGPHHNGYWQSPRQNGHLPYGDTTAKLVPPKMGSPQQNGCQTNSEEMATHTPAGPRKMAAIATPKWLLFTRPANSERRWDTEGSIIHPLSSQNGRAASEPPQAAMQQGMDKRENPAYRAWETFKLRGRESEVEEGGSGHKTPRPGGEEETTQRDHPIKYPQSATVPKEGVRGRSTYQPSEANTTGTYPPPTEVGEPPARVTWTSGARSYLSS